MIALFKEIVAAGQRFDGGSVFHGKDVDVVFSADVQRGDAFAGPAAHNRDLIDGNLRGQLNVIKDVLCIVPDRKLLCHIPFRIDHLIRTALAKKLCLNFAACLGYNVFCAEFLEQGSNLQRRLKVFSDCDEADIEVVHAERTQNGLVGAVADVSIRKLRRELVDDRFVLIHDHDSVFQLLHFDSESTAKAAHTDHKYRFHNSFVSFPMRVPAPGQTPLRQGLSLKSRNPF